MVIVKLRGHIFRILLAIGAPGRGVLALIALAAAAPVAAGDAVVAAAPVAGLHLLCEGKGIRKELEYSHSYAIGMGRAPIARTRLYRRPFVGAVRVDLSGDTMRVRLPAELAKASDAADGGYALGSPVIDAERIDGKLHLGFLNQVRVHIDRVTTTLAVEGDIGSFDGRCKVYYPANVERAF